LIPIFAYLANRAIASDQYSWGTRIDAWIIVIEIAKANPIFGLGFANYYWYTRLIPLRGYTARFNSHSQYVDLFAQVGLFGLICFLWFFAEVGWLALQLRNRADEGFPRAYVYAVFGGVVGTLAAAFLVDWVVPFVYNIGMNGFRASVFAWIFMGGLVSIEQSVRAKTEPQITD
jgi:O-antigen ligase